MLTHPQDRLAQLRQEILPFDAHLVAVSKHRSVEAIQQLYDHRQRNFGENRVQELLEKKPQLPDDIQWHFIGRLQTNKVKQLVPHVHLIHSLDRVKLVKEVARQAAAQDVVVDGLLQFHIAEESTKAGFELSEAREYLDEGSWRDYTHLRLCGVMGMATFTDDQQQVTQEFKTLKGIFDELKRDYFSDADYFREVSMGMSGDYGTALREGSTIVRVGSYLFNQ